MCSARRNTNSPRGTNSDQVIRSGETRQTLKGHSFWCCCLRGEQASSCRLSLAGGRGRDDLPRLGGGQGAQHGVVWGGPSEGHRRRRRTEQGLHSRPGLRQERDEG